jgi:hypothetical protein
MSAASVSAIVVGVAASAGTQGGRKPTNPPPRPRAPRLAWPKPRLVDPIVVRVMNPTTEITLDPTRDYVLKMPPYPVQPGPSGGLWIDGGHNVVIVGGALDFNRVSNANETNGRVAAIFNATGTVHIEGLRAYGSGLVEGIQNYADDAVVQIENCRFDHLRGTSDNHSDVLQFGVGRGLRVDRLTGSSNYQGIFLTDLTGPAILRHVNVRGDAGAQFLFWQGGDVPVSLRDVYIRPAPGRPILDSVWPSAFDPDPGRRPRYHHGSVSWPPVVRVSGSVHSGEPPHGDFVRVATAGARYVSPGYVGTSPSGG